MASGSAELKRFALGSIGERPAQPVYGLCRSAAGSGGFECLHHGHYLIAVTAAAGGLVWADTIARFRLGTDAADRVFAEILSTLSFLCMPKRQLACVTNCAAGLTGKSWLHRCAHLRLTDGVYICLAFHNEPSKVRTCSFAEPGWQIVCLLDDTNHPSGCRSTWLVARLAKSSIDPHRGLVSVIENWRQPPGGQIEFNMHCRPAAD